MTSHPCAGHSCDHCFSCEVLGICCLTAPAVNPGVVDTISATSATRGNLADLRTALSEDREQHAHVSLQTVADAQTVAAHPDRPDDLEPGTMPLALPPGRGDPLVLRLTGLQPDLITLDKEPIE